MQLITQPLFSFNNSSFYIEFLHQKPPQKITFALFDILTKLPDIRRDKQGDNKDG